MTPRDRLRPILSEVDALSPDELPVALGVLAEAQARILGRLSGPSNVLAANGGSPARPPESDRLLTVQEAAKRLGVEVRWLYRHHRDFAFTRKLGRRTLRFSDAGLTRYLAARRS